MADAGPRIPSRGRWGYYCLILATWACSGLLFWNASRRPAAGASEFEAEEVSAGLDRRIDEMRFDQVPLDEAISGMAQKTGARIEVRWDLLARANVARKTLIEVNLYDLSLASALDAVLENAGQLSQHPLAYDTDGRTITVTCDFDLPKVARVYDVR